eukprot:scaffold1785_cov247-Pinguiococcus_pyrenoidosus.AAC.21
MAPHCSAYVSSNPEPMALADPEQLGAPAGSVSQPGGGAVEPLVHPGLKAMRIHWSNQMKLIGPGRAIARDSARYSPQTRADGNVVSEIGRALAAACAFLQ